MNTKLRMENEIKFRQQLVAQIPCGKLSDETGKLKISHLEDAFEAFDAN